MNEYTIPPRLEEVEASVIGSLLSNETAMLDCFTRVTHEDFYHKRNADLYALAKRIYFQHGSLNLEVFTDRAVDAGVIAGMHELRPFLLAANPEQMDTLAGELLEYSSKRKLRKTLMDSLALVTQERVRSVDVQSRLIKDLTGVAVIGQASYYSIPQIQSQVQSGHVGVKLPVGDPILDQHMYTNTGSHLGTTEVILAHSKHGKSWYTAWRTAMYADQGFPGLVFTLEDSRDRIAKRIYTQMQVKENAGLVHVTDEVFNLDDIIAMIWRAKVRDGIKFVVIDYVQLVQVSGVKFHEELPRIVTASAMLTKAVKDNGVFGMICAQPKKPETPGGKEDWRMAPTVNMIYGSGQVLKDAYCVTSLFRPNKAKDLRYRKKHSAEIGVKRYDDDIVDWNSLFIKTEVTRDGVEDGRWIQLLHTETGLKVHQQMGEPLSLMGNWEQMQ